MRESLESGYSDHRAEEISEMRSKQRKKSSVGECLKISLSKNGTFP